MNVRNGKLYQGWFKHGVYYENWMKHVRKCSQISLWDKLLSVRLQLRLKFAKLYQENTYLLMQYLEY